MTTIHAQAPAPRFGKQPSKSQFAQLKDMIASLPLHDAKEIADHLTIGGVDCRKAGISMGEHLKITVGALVGFVSSLRNAKKQANSTGQPVYHVQWLKLPNTPAAQAWVWRAPAVDKEGENGVGLYKNGLIIGNHGPNLFRINRVEPKKK